MAESRTLTTEQGAYLEKATNAILRSGLLGRYINHLRENECPPEIIRAELPIMAGLEIQNLHMYLFKVFMDTGAVLSGSEVKVGAWEPGKGFEPVDGFVAEDVELVSELDNNAVHAKFIYNGYSQESSAEHGFGRGVLQFIRS